MSKLSFVNVIFPQARKLYFLGAIPKVKNTLQYFIISQIQVVQFLLRCQIHYNKFVINCLLCS